MRFFYGFTEQIYIFSAIFHKYLGTDWWDKKCIRSPTPPLLNFQPHFIQNTHSQPQLIRWFARLLTPGRGVGLRCWRVSHLISFIISYIRIAGCHIDETWWLDDPLGNSINISHVFSLHHSQLVMAWMDKHFSVLTSLITQYSIGNNTRNMQHEMVSLSNIQISLIIISEH